MNKDILKVRKRLLIVGIAAFFALGIMSFAISRSALTLCLSPEKLTGAPKGSADYVSFDVNSIIGFYAKEVKGKNPEPQVKYALVQAGDKLITVCIPPRYFQSANTVYNATLENLSGKAPAFDKYFTVRGTLTTLGITERTLLDDWYELNLEQMQSLGITGQNDSSAGQLSDYAIIADTIGGVSNAWAVSFSCISIIFTLFACALLIMSVLFWNKPSVFLDSITGFFIPSPANSESTAEPGASSPEEPDGSTASGTPKPGDPAAEREPVAIGAGASETKTETKEETDA